MDYFGLYKWKDKNVEKAKWDVRVKSSKQIKVGVDKKDGMVLANKIRKRGNYHP